MWKGIMFSFINILSLEIRVGAAWAVNTNVAGEVDVRASEIIEFRHHPRKVKEFEQTDVVWT